ncbi:YlxR family protein [Baekduia soli]|uniref:YlxR family protein n=1 Tax=Baekduia soli TaxID=496014 RepID=UPI003899288C
MVAADQRVVADPSATMPGRGAYVCDQACARRAVQRRAVTRALRRRVDIPQDFVESIGLHGEKAHP